MLKSNSERNKNNEKYLNNDTKNKIIAITSANKS